MIKLTGAEFKKFHSDDDYWTEGYFYEGEIILIDGECVHDDMGIYTVVLEEIDDNVKVEVSDGIVYTEDNVEVCSFESYIRKWRKLQNSVFFSVEASKEKADAVKSAIKAAGGKVLK